MNYRKENKTPLSKEEIAAMIGYWRQGASDESICWIMGVEYSTVENIISDYEQIFIKADALAVSDDAIATRSIKFEYK